MGKRQRITESSLVSEAESKRKRHRGRLSTPPPLYILVEDLTHRRRRSNAPRARVYTFGGGRSRQTAPQVTNPLGEAARAAPHFTFSYPAPSNDSSVDDVNFDGIVFEQNVPPQRRRKVRL